MKNIEGLTIPMITTGNIENKLKMENHYHLFENCLIGSSYRFVPLEMPGIGIVYKLVVEDLKSKGIIDAKPYGRSEGHYGEGSEILWAPPRWMAENTSNILQEGGLYAVNESGGAADPCAHMSQISPEYAGAHYVPGKNPLPQTIIDNYHKEFFALEPILEKNWSDHIKLKKELDDMWENSGIVKATMEIAGQAASGLIVYGLTDPALPSWAKNAIKICVGVGLGATAAGTGMRGLKRLVRRILIKAGAISTASAIILPIAMSFPPAAAWTVGVVTSSVVATSVALA